MNAVSSSGLTVERRAVGAAVVLEVAGDLDAASSPVLSNALIDAIEGGASPVVADLTGVGYVDSVGLGTLVIGLKRAAERNVAFRLVVTNPQIEKILKITGLLSVFQVYRDPQSAIADQNR